MKTILIDFSSIRAGGGVQLARNFLQRYHETAFGNYQHAILLPGEGELSKYQDKEPGTLVPGQSPQAVSLKSHPGTEVPGSFAFPEILHSPVSLVRRAISQHTTLQKFLRDKQIDAIYTFFGPGLPHPKAIPSLVSIAYPIICYPDSPFWQFIPLKQKLRQLLLNAVRRRRIRCATHILAETEVMKNRLAEHVGFDREKITVIPPAVSGFLQDRPGHPDRPCRNFLFLSGAAPHKNLWRLPAIAALAEGHGLELTFLLTITRENWEAQSAESRVQSAESRDQSAESLNSFRFLGSVASDRIGEVYESADALVNLSDLESFSNNYMEAWKSGVPLICSDRDFAREICGDSAIYVEPHNPQSVVDGIRQLQSSAQLRKHLIAEGKRKLSKLPTFEQRNNEIVKILESLT